MVMVMMMQGWSSNDVRVVMGGWSDDNESKGW